MNLIEFLRTTNIEDLGLPAPIIQKLRGQNLTEFQKVYASVQYYLSDCSKNNFSHTHQNSP